MKKFQIINTLTAIMCICALSAASCTQETLSDTDSDRHTEERLDSLRQIFRYYNVEGLYDTIISTARPVLQSALSRHDTMTVLLTGVYTAQAFLTMEHMDSTRHYMNIIEPYRKGGVKNPSLQTVLFTVEGLTYLKAELNYSLALESFREGCEWAKAGNDPNNHIVLLANIAHIFYVRGDKNGLQYAEEAYSISRSPDVEDFPRCQAHLLMGQMLLLSGRTQEAASYIHEAERMIENKQYTSLISICRLLYANMYQSNGEYTRAEQEYMDAMRWDKYAEASTATMIYLDYGDFLRMRGMPKKALAQYKTGLDISNRHNSLEFRRELLSNISDTYQILGDKASAAEYSYLYKSYVDSISSLQKEQEFNSRLLQYSQIEHEHEIQAKELALLKARRKSSTVIFISVIIIIVALSLYILYIRQRKANRLLVTQYETYMRRILPLDKESTESGTSGADKQDQSQSGDRGLFNRIEEMMKKQKIYRQKDLSLDRLAEMLSTNRTYVSKAINSCASQTFFNYVDMYRIREAVALLSDSNSGDVPFKHIADIVGYNSVQVFYRSFKRETGCSPGQYRDEARRLRKERSTTEQNR